MVMQQDQKYIDFLRWGALAAAFSGVLCLAGLIALFTKGLNLGLDFTGGVVVELRFKEEADIAEVASRLSDAGLEKALVVHFGSERDVLVRLPPTESKSIGEDVLQAVGAAKSGAELKRVDFVSSQIGSELRDEGGMAFLVSLLLVAAYVAARFQWKLSVGAIVAVFHDVLVTVGLFAIFGWEFDLPALAAVLSLVGYSINDTIVIYDRIRENFRAMRRVDRYAICNISLTQTLGRTLTTSALTQLVVVAMLLVGGQQLHSFSLALFIGIIAGSYSTVYIASALSLWLGLDRQDLMLPVKDERAAQDAP
jgi:preprotein translocase subunit SecF